MPRGADVTLPQGVGGSVIDASRIAGYADYGGPHRKDVLVAFGDTVACFTISRIVHQP